LRLTTAPTTTDPSAEIELPFSAPYTCAPPVAMLTRRFDPPTTSCTSTSELLFVSSGIKLEAVLRNTT